KHPCNDNLSNKIKRVERNGIISSERVEKLRIFRDYCGDTIHHDQVASVNGAYMVMKTAEEEMEFFKNKIDELKKIQYKIKGRQSQAAEQ
ncbi:MAG: hypothetical protein LIO53_08980, partial [Oscillospiraceae bacterium]|nr:hypothetical protein [Oscillospiraceae bacterium]